MFDIVTFGHPSLKMKSQDVENFDNELKEIDITNLKKLTLLENKIQVKQFIDSKNE